MIYRKHNGTLEPLSYQPSGGGSYSWDSVFPVGVTYIQYTTDDNPNNLFAGTTWTDITANFDESFFRIEGGDASGFGCGRQSDATYYNSNDKIYMTSNINYDHSHVSLMPYIVMFEGGLCTGTSPSTVQFSETWTFGNTTFANTTDITCNVMDYNCYYCRYPVLRGCTNYGNWCCKGGSTWSPFYYCNRM